VGSNPSVSAKPTANIAAALYSTSRFTSEFGGISRDRPWCSDLRGLGSLRVCQTRIVPLFSLERLAAWTGILVLATTPTSLCRGRVLAPRSSWGTGNETCEREHIL